MTYQTGKASIIVLTFNQLKYTQMCLESILEHTQDVPYELILVDNASEDGTAAYLKAFAVDHSQVKLHLNQTNEGFSRGNNLGATLADGEFLVLLNNDVIVTRGWLSGLLRHLGDPTVGMVGPVTNTSGNETRIRADYDELDEMPEFARHYTTAHAGHAFEIRMLPLLCAALRREVWDQIGPLDENFGLGMFEDDDYAVRLTQSGYRILCAEDVFVHHWGSAGFRRLGHAEYWQIFRQNRQKFEAKWNIDWIPTRYRDDLLDEQLFGMVKDKTDLATAVIDRDQIIQGLEGQLKEIYDSNDWKITQLIRRMSDRLAPKGSWREKVGQALVAVMLTLFRAARGMFRFLRSLRGKVTAVLNKRQYQRALRQILEENRNRREIILFTPSVSWGITLFQRPHQLALAMADLGCLVFFCEPPEVRAYQEGFLKIQDGLYIGNVGMEHFRAVPNPVAVTLVYNTHHLEKIPAARVIYDHIDELNVFHGDIEKLKIFHQEMVCSADLVIATADNLFKDVFQVRPDVLLCPNGVDYKFIQKTLAATDMPPEDIATIIESGKPVIGYYGALARWFDYELLSWAAHERPDFHFLLIGPDFDGTIQSTRMARQKNVSWLGPRQYLDIPRYLKYFSVATIPFKLNDITHATSPLKLFEYFAGGKPVVTTGMRECRKYQPVLIAEDKADYLDKLDEALSLRNDPAYLDLLDRTARENTWERRAETILKAIPAQKRPSVQSR